MTTLKDLLDLSKRIKDASLRKRVDDILRHPSLSGKSLKYQPADLKEAPASVGFHHVKKGGLVEHTYSVTMLSISVAESLQKAYNVEVDLDSLIAAALVHDIGKLWGMKKGASGWESTELMLDHTMLGTAELYSRGFPEKVLHIVASHFGPEGPTPPQTLEAKIFHLVDNFDASVNTVSQEDIIRLLVG